jgi:hypothetical protein
LCGVLQCWGLDCTELSSLNSKDANVLRNCDNGRTSRSWIDVHSDNTPLQSPWRHNTVVICLQIGICRCYAI